MTTDHPQKITFGEMRESGVRDVLVYCRDHHCSQDQRRLLAGPPSPVRHRGQVRVPGLRQARRGHQTGLSAGRMGTVSRN
jgi:hypothetical protein